MALDPWSYAKKTNTEHAHQASLFMWANMAAMFGFTMAEQIESYTVTGWAAREHQAMLDATLKHTGMKDLLFQPLPMLKWLHAIPNQGTASVQRGSAMKSEGLKSGVFDVFLPYPVNVDLAFIKPYAGLYVEMKRPKTATQVAGKLSTEQQAFKTYAESVGYKCAECWTWLEARNAIRQYLGVSNG